MSSLFRSTLIKGNRITDFADTSATVGVPIPFGYGKFPVPGNVLWCPLPPKEHRAVRRQGKGGVKQETYAYTLSYAIAFCLAPLVGYQWIKRNGKIVYTTDPNATIEDQEYSAKWLEKATLYYGGPNQLPDSTIESYEGSGQVSAFKHLSFVVVEDDDVTEGGGAVPSYEACAIAQGIGYSTTPPYAIEVLEDPLGVTQSLQDLRLRNAPSGLDFVGAAHEMVTFSMFGGAVDHVQPAEDFMGTQHQLTQVNLFGGAVDHVQPAEDFMGVGQHMTLINLFGEAITHDQPVEDFMGASHELLLITLEDA